MKSPPHDFSHLPILYVFQDCVVILCTTKVKFVNCAIQILYFNRYFSAFSISYGEKHINISLYGDGFLCFDNEKIISLCWFCLHWVKPKLCLHVSQMFISMFLTLILCSCQYIYSFDFTHLKNYSHQLLIYFPISHRSLLYPVFNNPYEFFSMYSS